MADKGQNPIDALLQELISRRRSATSFFEDLDSSSFVEGFLEVSSSKLNESVRELIEFLGKTFSDENLKNLLGRIERARIPTQDKRVLGEGLYISNAISDILTELGSRLDELGDKSEFLRKELDFLTNSFDELKTYAGKNLREFIQEYQEILDTQKESLEEFIEEMGGVRQFGRYFYLSRLDKNQYREESYLISQPGFFRSFEDYVRLAGPGALFKSTESLIKSAIEDIKFTSSLSSFLKDIPVRERIFNPDISTFTDFYRSIFRRIPQELAQAKQFINASLLELNERINTLLKAPESERDYISLSKLVTQREELQKRLLALLREEVEFRQEFNRRTYGMFLEASKDFGLRAVDKIFSTTRNPFVDIFTESLRFALNIGTKVYSGTRNLLDLVPIGIPRGGPSRRAPTGPSSPPPSNRPSSPSNKPSPPPGSTTTSPKTKIPPILRGAGRVAGGAAVGLVLGVTEDIIFEKKSFREAVTSPSNIGLAIGSGLGAFFGIPGAIVGGVVGNYIGSLFERNQKNANVREISLKELSEKTSRPTTFFIPNISYDFSTLKMLSGSTERGEEERTNFTTSIPPNFNSSALSILNGSVKRGGEERKYKDVEELPFLVTQSLQSLGLAALTTSGSLNNLGLSAGKLSVSFGELVKTSGSLLTGGTTALGAFTVDFYLQSMNKAYDIYYQQFAQQNLMPQMIRRQLGTTTAEISRNLVTPETGLLFRGPLSVAGLGFERTELLAGASRVGSQMLIKSAEDLAGRLKEAANVARIFGTNLEQGVEAIALLRRATLRYSDLFTTSYVLARTEPTAFTKAMAEAVIQASLSLSIQQGISPRRYLESFERIQTLFITSSNKALAELARNNIEITRNFVNSLNEFIRSGLNNPIVGGIGIRAGLTPRDMLLGATPESITRIIRQLSLELGLPGTLVGGRFGGQAREYLLPLIQNLLGLTNISPDAFNEIVLSVITGRDAQAQRLIREAQRRPLPSAIPSDREFARNIDQLNISFQALTDVLSRNIDSITKLNEAINNLAISFLGFGDRILPFVLEKIAELSKEASSAIKELSKRASGKTSLLQERNLTLPLGEKKLTSSDIQQAERLLLGGVRPVPLGTQQAPRFLPEIGKPPSLSTQQTSGLLGEIRPIPPGTQQASSLISEARRPIFPGTQQAPSLIPESRGPIFPGTQQTPSLVPEAGGPISPGTQQTPSLVPEARRPIFPGTQQTPGLMLEARRPIPPSTQQAPSLVPEARRQTSPGTQQAPGLVLEARRPIFPGTQQAPGLVPEARRPIFPGTQQAPGLVPEARRPIFPGTQQAPGLVPEARRPIFPGTQQTPGLVPEARRPIFPGTQQTPGLVPEARRPIFPGTQQTPGLVPEARRPIFPGTQQTPSLIPEARRPIFPGTQQAPGLIPEARRPTFPGTQQAPGLVPEARRPTSPSIQQALSLVPEARRPIPPSTQQAPNLVPEARTQTSPGTQQVPGLMPEARRPIFPGTQQTPSLVPEARRPIFPGTQQAPGLIPEARRPTSPGIQQAPSLIPEARRPTSPSTQQTPSLAPEARRPTSPGTQQTPSLIPEARRPTSPGTQQAPSLMPGARRPTSPGIQQAPSLVPEARRPTSPGAQQTPGLIPEARRPTSPGTQQAPNLIPEAKRPTSPGIQQTPSLIPEARRPTSPGTQQAPGLVPEARKPTSPGTQQAPSLVPGSRNQIPLDAPKTSTRKEVFTFLKETITAPPLLVTEGINRTLQSLSASSNVNKEGKISMPTTKDMVDSVVSSLLSSRGFPVSKTITQSETNSSLGTYVMDKEAATQLSQLPPSYSGYALVKIERVPEQLTTQLIETIIRNINKKGGK